MGFGKLLDSIEGKVLFVFPHFDDCAFVSSGFLQKVTENNKLKPHVSIFYEHEDHKAKSEFLRYSKTLGIEDYSFIRTTHKSLEQDLYDMIKVSKPSVVVTFDPGGVTGNSHHTMVSLRLYEVIKKLNTDRPVLLWRIADEEEKKYFGNTPNPFGKVYENVYSLNLSFGNSIKKIKAIFANNSKIKGFMYKLRILEWYLWDHKEQYYMVDFKKDKLNIKYF